MWFQIIYLVCLISVVVSETTAPGIDRTISNGVYSMGHKVVYGDEDVTIINQVVTDMEKSNFKKKVNLNEAIPPLPQEDVKCLMSVDRYCSKKMGAMKSVLIQALKEDCAKCTIEEKESAGKIVASLMAHDPVAWKLFLTRSALQAKPPKKTSKQKDLRFKIVGEPEEIITSKYRYMKPGFNVRVKRYLSEKMP